MFAKISDSVVATVRYARRENERLATEKPYILHYAAPLGFPQNNFAIDSFPGIEMHNLRSAGISYQEHGMMVASLDSSGMRPEDFNDDEWIERVYLPELHRCICRALGAQDVTIFDWMLRKRSKSFPSRSVGEENEEAAQPSLSAHIGQLVSLLWLLKSAFDDTKITPRQNLMED
ncbi:MAG: hypothetical protein LQ342_003977 [Letrouitia transgressa]|nr:MAG: hypothetical protein LQ342_003977 [Letrouitia transgressa]